MTTTSQHLARIRFPATWPAAGDAIGPVNARDVAVNNVNHRADVVGQCRANFSGCALAGPGFLHTDDSSYGRLWHQVYRSAPWSIPLMPDGTPYRVRLALGASSSDGNKVRFAVTLGRVGTSRSLLGATTTTTASDQVWLSSEITSTTPAYRTGASQGVSAYARCVGMSSVEAGSCVSTFSTIDGVGGVPVTGVACVVELVVYGWAETVGSVARLYALSAYEVI